MDDRIDKKLDKLNEQLMEVNKLLAVYSTQLALHMKRSDNLEKLVALTREEIDDIRENQAKFQGGIKVSVWGAGILLTLANLSIGLLKLGL